MAKIYTVTLTLPNGKRKYYRGSTKKEAEAKREKDRRLIDGGIDISCELTVEQLVEEWLKMKKPDVRDVTYLSMSSLLNAHLVPSLGKMLVIKVKPMHINRMMAEKNHLAKSSQHELLRLTRAVFATAVDNDIIVKNPCVPSIKPRGEVPEKPTALTENQVTELLDTAKDTELYLFVLLGLKAGLRRGELLGLMWEDIDYERGTLSVRRSISTTQSHRSGEPTSTLKTEAAHRKVALPWEVVSELREAQKTAESPYVVGFEDSYLSLSRFTSKWTVLAKDLSFPCHPHLLRHTCVTSWFGKGLDIKEVQYLAGHTKPEITLGIYTHYVAEDRFEDTIRKCQQA